MDSAIDAATAQERSIRRIHNRIDVQRDDIALPRFELVTHRAQSKRAVGEPAFHLVESVDAPKGFAIDHHIR